MRGKSGGQRGDIQVVINCKFCLTEPREGRLHLTRLTVDPSHESHGTVKQQVALGLTTAHQQHGILFGLMLTAEPVVVDIIEDIDIVQQDGFVITEQVLRLLQSTTGLKQCLRLVAELHEGCIVLLGDIVDNLLGEMVDVDDKAIVALSLQLTDVPLQQGLATHGHQCLGHRVGKRFEPGSESGG